MFIHEESIFVVLVVACEAFASISQMSRKALYKILITLCLGGCERSMWSPRVFGIQTRDLTVTSVNRYTGTRKIPSLHPKYAR